ncbi:WecB/TagA/CpsF family glycosyltransferase [Bradyrhizobium sp. PMVTL-01]|uniref:WecB/TagA/CpsF family glycosyltransferase n=1 Tax=Bradyrhizobium sp. PMVTL-01 TaxID=3434999 RepID=UPI003F6E8D01
MFGFLTYDGESLMLIDLLRKVRVFASGNHCVDWLNSMSSGPAIVSFLNAHAVNLCCRNSDFNSALLGSHVLLRDGVGVEMIMRAAGLRPGINNNGTDFIPKLLRSRPGARVAVIGTEEPWLSTACARIEELGARVVVAIDGFQQLTSYVHKIRESTPDFVVLGMGMPKQEFVAAELVKQLDRQACLILNGGAILDFLADRFPRAPHLLRRFRMEWLFRLLLEPRRLGRRYILGGVIFSARIARVAWICRGDRKAKGQA